MKAESKLCAVREAAAQPSRERCPCPNLTHKVATPFWREAVHAYAWPDTNRLGASM